MKTTNANMIEVHYFASVRERLGLDSERIAVTQTLVTVNALIEALVQAHGEKWHKVLREGKILCAVNQVVAQGQTLVKAGDEVAFFPPVTGG